MPAKPRSWSAIWPAILPRATEFDELRRLFDGLSSIPKAYPPEGLVASVMARLPQQRTGQGRPPPTFLAATCNWTRFKGGPGYNPGEINRVPRFSRQGPYFRSDDMSEQKSGSFGKRKIVDWRRHRRGGRGPRDIFGNRFPAGQQGYGGHDRAGAAVSRAAKHGR